MQLTERARGPAALWPLRRPEGLLRLLKFGVVGGSGVLVNLGLLALLHDAAGLPLLAAAALSFEASVANNYLWNDFWTFATRSPSPRRLLKFNLVSLGSMAVSLSVLHSLTALTACHYLLAALSGIALGFLASFSLNCLWTWRR